MDELQEALVTATGSSDLEGVKRALAAGAAPETKNYEEVCAVCESIDNGDYEIVEAFLDAGLDPNVGTADGQMPLMVVAAYCETPEAVRIAESLLARGADVDGAWAPEGETALTTMLESTGATKTKKELLRILIKAGADLEKPRGDGFRPLQLASAMEDPFFCQALLEAGADLTATRVGHDDVDAMSVAEYRGYEATMKVLSDCGATDPVHQSKDKLLPLWKRIELGFASEQDLSVPLQLQTPAPADNLVEIASFLDRALAADLSAQWSLYGAGCSTGIWEYELLATQQVLSRMEGLRDLLKDAEWAANEPRELDKSAQQVRFEWWNPAWVPVAQDGGGNLICVDHSPEIGGVHGQVIYWEIHAGPVGPIARSWSEFVEQYAADVEAGGWGYGDGGLFRK